jgi:AcrR family transcriptional regulator
MKTSRVSTIRREQIVEAAIAVIAEQGIQHLSLSEIEKKTALARGQLMYYFRCKEDILLAVFDRLLQMMLARVESGNGNGGGCTGGPKGWERLRHFLTLFVLTPPNLPAFHSLQYTFLSQISHREDFRQRLANLYDAWRVHMAEDFQDDLARRPANHRVSPRLFASLVQAILHGLSVQRSADPDAYDRQEMLDLILDLLGGYLHPAAGAPNDVRDTPSFVKSKAARASRPGGSRRGPARGKKVNHE